MSLHTKLSSLEPSLNKVQKDTSSSKAVEIKLQKLMKAKLLFLAMFMSLDDIKSDFLSSKQALGE